ncbi:TIGR04219 family outer membrane beta-barrel protein [Alishewanella sp. d11]|uniref:TIGR04219 family outer membrane beta-barrel protein n=1 Tax=Alishewanella sp. d11 TaxID=3414030 RepID=UPI003BF8CC8C
MIRLACALALAVFGYSAKAQADTVIGIYAGADFWQSESSGRFANNDPMQAFTFADRSQQAYYLAFEHFVPVLPNVRVQHAAVKVFGEATLTENFQFAGSVFPSASQLDSSLSLRTTDYIFYYELFDNPLLALDLGVGAKNIQGDVAVTQAQLTGTQPLNQWLPMLYTATQVSILATGFDVFASGSLSGDSDSQFYDVQAGLAYQFTETILLNARFKLGVRAMELQFSDLDNLDADVSIKGIFAGIELHF